MRTLFRYLLWILIAALPLQGGAVAFMSCEQMTMPAPHAQQGAEMASAAAPHAHCDLAKAGHVASTHGKCSHCASCFVGQAAPPSVPAIVAPATFSTFALVAGEPAMIVHIPATLERPPRSLV